MQDALEDGAISQRIYPPTLEAVDLASLLRSASAAAGDSATIHVSAAGSYPPEAVIRSTSAGSTPRSCRRARRGAKATIDVHDRVDVLTFRITGAEIGSATDSTASGSESSPRRAPHDHVAARLDAEGARNTRSRPR